MGEKIRTKQQESQNIIKVQQKNKKIMCFPLVGLTLTYTLTPSFQKNNNNNNKKYIIIITTTTIITRKL